MDNIRAVEPIIEQLCSALDQVQKLYNFQRGSGISAPQIGQLKRISVVEYEGVRQILINPKIVQHSPEKVPIKEGCLSFFNYRANVPRYSFVVVEAMNRNGETIRIQARDNFAMLLQHEIDHLDGILYINHLPNREKDLQIVDDMPEMP